MRVAAFALALAFVLGACSAVAPPLTPGPVGPTVLFTPPLAPGPIRPKVLHLENRGGPAFTIRIGDTEIASVACNSGAALTPGQDAVPQLPWDLTLIRVRDSSAILVTHVGELPRWFTQIGDDPLGGLSTFPVAGPPGPSCPPEG